MPKHKTISFSVKETQRIKDALHFYHEEYQLNLAGFIPAKIRNRLASADAKMQALDASDASQKCPLTDWEFAAAGWAVHYVLDRLQECAEDGDDPSDLLPPSLLGCAPSLSALFEKIRSHLLERGIEI